MNFVQPIRDLEKIGEVRRYLAARSARDELLFCFGIYTGLRISDILKVKVRDVYGKDYFYIVEQKTKNRRKNSKARNKAPVRKRVPIVPKLKRLLDKYCFDLNEDEYLFRSRQGRNRPITRVRSYDILREAAKRCELSEIGTHTLRKTFGYWVYHENEKDVALLQDIFGHSAPYITLKYIGVNQEVIEKAYQSLNKLKF